jgi:hypothetical protein
MENILRLLIALTLVLVILVPGISIGFEVNTHAVLSQRAIDVSVLNDFLTRVLSVDFPEGVSQRLRAGQNGLVRELISEEGSKNEDKPSVRSRFHFHDPTQPWNNAGLRWPIVGQVGESSVLWGQNANQVTGGKHSWQDARSSYYNALTSANESDRKKYFAETFESLGHLIHLIQDAATPSHTRNDTHIPFLFDFDRFHQWANRPNILAAIGSQSQPFDPSIFTLPANPLAPIPIARIIDTEAYRGSGIPTTPSALDNIGIAEFSSGNFFSDDTILTGYTHPAASSMDLAPEPVSSNGPSRFYLRKNRGPGAATGYRAAVASRLSGFVPPGFPTQQWDLDDNVMADYGVLLFPRAIGYSAGLIDYFFRGHIAQNLYRILDAPADNPPTALTNQLWGPVAPEEQTGAGTVVLVLVYRSQDFTTETFPSYVVSTPVTANVTSGPQDVTFSFDSLPFPNTLWGSVTYHTLLVYRGLLGTENDAVIASVCGDGFSFERFLNSQGQVRLFAGVAEGCVALP